MDKPVNQLSHIINPVTNGYLVWDTTECYAYQENVMDAMLSIGFEPYAISLCPDPRTQEPRSKINMPGVPPNPMMSMTNKIWMKRPRHVDSPTVALDEVPTITPGDSL